MALRLGFACCLVIGCSNTERFDRVYAPERAALPLQLSGDGRYELWTALRGGTVGEVAYSGDGHTWTTYELPQLRGDRALQVAADNNRRAWIVGTSHADTPALLALTLDTGEGVVTDHSDVFPSGTTEVTLGSGGWDPDPMITARVPGTLDLTVFVLRERPGAATWVRHPMANVRALVGIYGAVGGYFATTRGAAPDALVYCALPDDSAHCFDVPALSDDLANIFPATPTPTSDWLWRPDAGGGLLVRRRGGEFEVRNVAEWPSGLEAVRFFALETGALGVLATRGASTVWVALDSNTRAVRELDLGACDCDLDAEKLVMLPDGMLTLPTSDGWVLIDPPGI